MSEILGMLVIFAPLFIIIALANVAEGQRERGAGYRGIAITSYILVALLYLLAIAIGLGLQSVKTLSTTQPQLFAGMAQAEIDYLILLGSGLSPATLLWLLVGLFLLLPPIRRLVARLIPIDPVNPVHGIALAFTVLVVVNLLFTLGIGLSNLADVLAEQEAAGITSNTMASLWAQQIFTALLGMLGVGWLVRRGTQATLARLGIVIPSFGQALFGLLLGLGLVPVIMAIEWLTANFNVGIDPGVEKLTEQLLGPLFTTPLGIVTIGVAAALGEETIFRGAIQPRFGLIFTALLFALVHSNYGLSLSTLIVFLLGLVLGLVRLRANTTTAMITHAVYNMSLALLAYLNL